MTSIEINYISKSIPSLLKSALHQGQLHEGEEVGIHSMWEASACHPKGTAR